MPSYAERHIGTTTAAAGPAALSETGEMETTLRGVGVSHGVAIGEVRHMGTAVLEPPAKQIPVDDAPREQNRARRAVEAVAADLSARDRKSTRLNSSHSQISYAVFCLKKKKKKQK